MTARDPARTFLIVHLNCRAAHVDPRTVSQDAAAQLASCARKFARACWYRGETLACSIAEFGNRPSGMSHALERQQNGNRCWHLQKSFSVVLG